MPAKKTKQAIESKDTSHQELTPIEEQLLEYAIKHTPIEKQLLECARKHTPVLLYGKDIVYYDLILRTYNEALIEQGIDGIVNFELEYFDKNGNPVSIEELKEANPTYAHKDAILKRLIARGTYLYSESTVRTRKIIDCTGLSGKEVYKELVELPVIEDKEFYPCEKRGELKTMNDIDYEQQLNKGYLFYCKGLLLLNNLQINPGNSEDFSYYNKLAKVIRDKGVLSTFLCKFFFSDLFKEG